MNLLLYAVADELMFADAVLLQHGETRSSNVHHYIANHLKMAPHRLGGTGRGCHLADLQVSVDGAEANDNDIADDRDDDCVNDVDAYDDRVDDDDDGVDDDDGADDDDDDNDNDDDDCEMEPDTDD